MDTLAEIVINTSSRLQEEKIQNLRDVFNAADLDQSGTLEYQEFKILFKLMTDEKTSAAKIFDKYCNSDRKITQESFEKACSNHELFTIKAQNKFLGNFQRAFASITEPNESFVGEMEKLKLNLDTIISLLRTTIEAIPAESVS